MNVHQMYSSLSPVYGGGLTNHLPMMITALKYLEVEDHMIKEISKTYVDTRGIFDLNGDLVKSNYDEEYIKISNFYLTEINKSSIEVVVKTFLNKHRFGLHSALFHGLIRLAYAYMEYDELLVAQALSYFELSYKDGKLVGEGITYSKMNERFDRLVEYRKKGIHFQSRSTMSKYQEVLGEDFIRTNLFYPVDILRHKDAMLRLFLDQYIKTNDFYMLHVLTGFHALHILSQFFIEEVQVYRNFFMQSTVFLLLNDYETLMEDRTYGEFYDLVHGVRNLEDAHDIKFFFSLVYFYDKYEMDDLKIPAYRLFQK